LEYIKLILSSESCTIMKIRIVTLCSLVGGHKRFGRQGYMASQPRRQQAQNNFTCCFVYVWKSVSLIKGKD
jgi:hypothetical protein